MIFGWSRTQARGMKRCLMPTHDRLRRWGGIAGRKIPPLLGHVCPETRFGRILKLPSAAAQPEFGPRSLYRTPELRTSSIFVLNSEPLWSKERVVVGLKASPLITQPAFEPRVVFHPLQVRAHGGDCVAQLALRLCQVFF